MTLLHAQQQQMFEQIKTYLDANEAKVQQQFQSLTEQDGLPATSVFPFLKCLFTPPLQPVFCVKDKNYFQEEQNQSSMEKLIQSYYKTTPAGQLGKFYLYRIKFSFEDILSLLSYWCEHESTLKVFSAGSQTPRSPTHTTPPSKATPTLKDLPQENQFFVPEENTLNATHQADRDKNVAQSNAQQHAQQNITKLNPKATQRSEEQQIQKPTSVLPSLKLNKLKLKNIFDFYAKQISVTGVLASFDRIQHQSQTINYQKLVHFLREHNLFPPQPAAQKKLHNLYVRTCSNSRDLYYPEFIAFLEKLHRIEDSRDRPTKSQRNSQAKSQRETSSIGDKSSNGFQSEAMEQSLPPLPVYSLAERTAQESPFELMLHKISEKYKGNQIVNISSSPPKLLNNPFHSLQNPNFRVDPASLRYEFKLKPLRGQLQASITDELQHRRALKVSSKQMLQQAKEEKKMRQLKRLMQIDPYHPDAINSKMGQKHPIIEPIAKLEDIEKYRDKSFDMKNQFGIDNVEEDVMKEVKGDLAKHLKNIERKHAQKMDSLLHGILERNDAKVDKISRKHG